MNKQMLTQPKALHRAQNIVKRTREKSECDVMGLFPKLLALVSPLASLMLETVRP